MSRSFTASVLLERPWTLDIDVVAAIVRRLFPEVGQIGTVPGQSESGQSGLLTIDGGHVVITSEERRVADRELAPDLKTIKAWDFNDAVARHHAHLTISCGGRLPGIEGAKAYAAAVHFVTAALAAETEALGVLWHPGFVVSSPEQFIHAANGLLSGRIPLSSWVGFASIVPRGYGDGKTMGMVTYGMRPFLDRELELAPRPGSAREAHRWISTVALRTLADGTRLADGTHLTYGNDDVDVVLRERNYWLRRNLSAFVLVAPDAVVEVESLRPRPRRADAA